MLVLSTEPVTRVRRYDDCLILFDYQSEKDGIAQTNFYSPNTDCLVKNSREEIRLT